MIDINPGMPGRAHMARVTLRMLLPAVILVGLATAWTATPALAAPRRPNGNTVPWQNLGYWPHFECGTNVCVRYQQEGDRDKALQVLGYLETAWTRQVTDMTYPAPLPDLLTLDPTYAGSDAKLDAYLWRGIGTFYVDEVSALTSPTTWTEDRSTHVVLDPWSQYGATDRELEANIYHEFRHAVQAVDDWWEHIWAFEADATVFEAREHGYDRLVDPWTDFQAHPDWGLFRDDGYVTWYMYGGGLFLDFLSARRYGGSLDYLPDMWAASQDEQGHGADPATNLNDFVKALNGMLPGGINPEIVEFARARWYTGGRTNVMNTFTSGGWSNVPAPASLIHTRNKNSKTTKINVDPMMAGTHFVVVQGGPGETSLLVSRSGGASGVDYVVQVVGEDSGYTFGAPVNDGVLSLPQRVHLGGDGQVVLAVTALPQTGIIDPDLQTDTRYRTTLSFAK